MASEPSTKITGSFMKFLTTRIWYSAHELIGGGMWQQLRKLDNRGKQSQCLFSHRSRLLATVTQQFQVGWRESINENVLEAFGHAHPTYIIVTFLKFKLHVASRKLTYHHSRMMPYHRVGGEQTKTLSEAHWFVSNFWYHSRRRPRSFLRCFLMAGQGGDGSFW